MKAEGGQDLSLFMCLNDSFEGYFNNEHFLALVYLEYVKIDE